MKIFHRIVLVGLVSLLAFLGVASSIVLEKYQERAIFQEMKRNIGLIQAASRAIDSLQKERGGTALFLSGGSDESTVRALRAATDTALPMFRDTPGWTLPERERQACRDKIAELPAAFHLHRARSQPEGQGLCRVHSHRFGLAPRRGARLNTRTTKGLGKVLGSLVILEVAKESAGSPANGAGLLAWTSP